MRGLLIVVVLALALSCSKKSPAHPGFESFVNGYYGHGDPAAGFAVDGIKLTQSNSPPDELTEGIAVFPVNNVGHLEWLKVKLIEDTPAADGDKELRESVDICFAGDDQNNCNRPNSYEFRALMRSSEGTWIVAGATHRELNTVR